MLSDVVGQERAVHFLQRVVTGGIQSPLLLIGEEGTGRKFSTLEAIKEMVAHDRGGPSSPEVLQITKGLHPDVIVFTPEADKDIGVEAMRSLVDQASSYPSASPHRFFVVDGADRMTPAAANAILKTLEEPPARSMFFLLAEAYDRVLPTIRSRCGRVPFGKLPESFIISRLSSFEKDANKALVYARMGEGSVGRAARYWGSSRLVFRDNLLSMVRFGLEGDLSSAFAMVDDVSKELTLALRFLRFLAHDLLVLPFDPSRVINQDILEGLQAMRDQTPETTWLRLWDELKAVHVRHESSFVNLHFHLKTALLTTFSVG